MELYPGGNQEISTFSLREDELHIIMGYITFDDLKSSRLVCKMWWFCGTTAMKRRTRHVCLLTDQRIQSFVHDHCGTEMLHELPYGRFWLQFRTTCSKCSSNVQKILNRIRRIHCHELVISHCVTDCKYYDRSSHILRQESLSFRRLDRMRFNVKFDASFLSGLLNMKEILYNNEVKSVALQCASELSVQAQEPILTDILTCLTDAANHAKLSSLEISIYNLTDQQLNILETNLRAIKHFKLCNIAAWKGRSTFTSSKLSDLLSRQSNSLKSLELEFQVSGDWFNTDEQDLGDAADVESFHFPVMNALEKLEFSTHEVMGDATEMWDISENSFTRQLPMLKTLSYKRFFYGMYKTQRVTFFPMKGPRTASVSALQVPYATQNHTFPPLRTLLLQFSCIQSLEIGINRDHLADVFRHLPTLQILSLNLGDFPDTLDDVLIGDPRLTRPLTTNEARNYDLQANKIQPGLADLAGLRRLVLTTKDNFIRISDVVGFKVFLALRHFQCLKCDASPTIGTTKWLFSDECLKEMRLKFNVIMSVLPQIQPPDIKY